MPNATSLTQTGLAVAAVLVAAPIPMTISRLEPQAFSVVGPELTGTVAKTWDFDVLDVGWSSAVTTHAVLAAAPDVSVAARRTTPVEDAIGQIREWASLGANWDGEGASAPIGPSLREAASFLALLAPTSPVPDPMLLASGRAGLYWNDNKIYADLEFTGDRRVVYYIEQPGGGKHKGVVPFDGEHMPAVFSALLLV